MRLVGYLLGTMLVAAGALGIARGRLPVPLSWLGPGPHRDADVRFLSYLVIALGCGLLFAAWQQGF